MAHTVYIALGGNLGDVLATFAQALARMGECGLVVRARSRLYRTAALVPAGAPPGPDYWNAAVRAETHLAPREVLDRLLSLEAEAGRVRRERWAARPLDLDLLLYDDLVLNDAELTLPHPRLHERAFVLLPLADLAPEAVIPGQARTVRELLARTDAQPLEVRPFTP